MQQIAYLTLTAFGLATFGLAAFYITKLPESVITTANATIIQGILSSICASFVFLLTLDTGNYVREFFIGRAFKKFFGELSSSETATLVYPDFVLSDECRNLLKTMPSDKIYRKRADQYPGTRFIDVPKIVASNDLQAIVIVATRMGRYTRNSPILITDGEAVANPARSLISFGLTSNAVTDLYQNTDPNPLFRIDDAGGEPKLLVTDNGKVDTYMRNEQHQHAIVLRYRPNPKDYPRNFWFICAGLGAAGTPAAAWNLAHKWKEYHRRFGDKDFLIVLKTSNDVHSYVTQTEVRAISR
jgi:hypothetical protein